MNSKRRIQTGAEKVQVMLEQTMQNIYNHMQEQFPGMSEAEIDAMLKDVLTEDEVLRKRMTKPMGPSNMGQLQ